MAESDRNFSLSSNMKIAAIYLPLLASVGVSATSLRGYFNAGGYISKKQEDPPMRNNYTSLRFFPYSDGEIENVNSFCFGHDRSHRRDPGSYCYKSYAESNGDCVSLAIAYCPDGYLEKCIDGAICKDDFSKEGWPRAKCIKVEDVAFDGDVCSQGPLELCPVTVTAACTSTTQGGVIGTTTTSKVDDFTSTVTSTVTFSSSSNTQSSMTSTVTITKTSTLTSTTSSTTETTISTLTSTASSTSETTITTTGTTSATTQETQKTSTLTVTSTISSITVSPTSTSSTETMTF